jgi:hypothetical protein
MDETPIETLWARLLDEQALSKHEESELRRQLSQDESVRARMLGELQVDRLLRCVASDVDEDAFVESFVSRLESPRQAVAFPVPPGPNQPGPNQPGPNQPGPNQPGPNQPAPGRSLPLGLGSESVGEPPVVAPPVSWPLSVAEPQQPYEVRSRHRPSNRSIPFALASAAIVLIVIGATAVVSGKREQPSPRRTDPQQETPSPLRSRESESIAGQPTWDRAHPENIASEFAPSIVASSETASSDVASEPFAPSQPMEDSVIANVPPPKLRGAMAAEPDRDAQVGAERASMNGAQSPSPNDSPVIARITGAEDAVWYAGNQPSTELAAGTLRLAEGIAHISMSQGAVLTLTAPAELELVAAQNVSLHSGTLKALVPRQAVGFEVVTPSSRVVDLGTEFDVSVDEAGATSVRVARGTVEMNATTNEAKEQTWRLGAGQFKWISADAADHLDWRLSLTTSNQPFASTLSVNGERITFSQPSQFATASMRLVEELTKLRQLAPSQTDGSFRGEIDVNGERFRVTNSSEAAQVSRDVIRQFRQLWLDALRNNGIGGFQFGGEININGESFSIDRFEALIEAQKAINEGLKK